MQEMHKPRILVIDDEQDLVEFIRNALVDEGMEVFCAGNATEGLQLVHEVQPDLILLDIIMPGCDGWETCRRLRQVSTVPIVMLTARTDRDDIIRGLKLGADDYMRKPFSLAELSARIEALLRRVQRSAMMPPARLYAAGDVSVDLLSHRVTVGERVLRLRPKEFELMAYLVRNPGRTIPHQELLRQVWGNKHGPETQALKRCIWHLRKCVEEDPERPRRILTARGLGYRFVPVNE